jgi:hypothetical protein
LPRKEVRSFSVEVLGSLTREAIALLKDIDQGLNQCKKAQSGQDQRLDEQSKRTKANVLELNRQNSLLDTRDALPPSTEQHWPAAQD